MTDTTYVPSEIIEQIASYSQLPKLRSISREARDIEDSLTKFRDDQMDREFPNWKYDRDINRQLHQLGKGNIEQIKYYIQNSPALWEFLQQYIPIEEVISGAIENENIDLLEELLKRYHLKNVGSIYQIAINRGNYDILDLLGLYYHIPASQLKITPRMPDNLIKFIIQHAEPSNMHLILKNVLNYNMSDEYIHRIFDALTYNQFMNLWKQMNESHMDSDTRRRLNELFREEDEERSEFEF